MNPTVGRIVLVKSPAFYGECPAIVTAVFGTLINVRVFLNTDENVAPLITALQQQDESSCGWGWRWPPREEVSASMQRRQAYEREYPPTIGDPTPAEDSNMKGASDASGLPGDKSQ